MVTISLALRERLTYAQLIEATHYLLADPKIDDKARYGGTLHAADWIRASEAGVARLYTHKEMIHLCSKEGLTTDDFVAVGTSGDDGDTPIRWRRRFL